MKMEKPNKKGFWLLAGSLGCIGIVCFVRREKRRRDALAALAERKLQKIYSERLRAEEETKC